jgi:AcrR family transcriptional regulator
VLTAARPTANPICWAVLARPEASPWSRSATPVRNRTKILTAAERLVAAHGVEALTMNEVARAAGVGVGTVYRRFGDHGGLIEAMMNERESRLQQAFSSGPPPLGPGAPPARRIQAFLHAYADLLDTYADLLDAYGPLMAAAEATMPTPRRYRTGPYAVHHRHLATLITEARRAADAAYLADALLAPLAAGLFTHQRRHDRMSLKRIKVYRWVQVGGAGGIRTHTGAILSRVSPA